MPQWLWVVPPQGIHKDGRIRFWRPLEGCERSQWPGVDLFVLGLRLFLWLFLRLSWRLKRRGGLRRDLFDTRLLVHLVAGDRAAGVSGPAVLTIAPDRQNSGICSPWRRRRICAASASWVVSSQAEAVEVGGGGWVTSRAPQKHNFDPATTSVQPSNVDQLLIISTIAS